MRLFVGWVLPLTGLIELAGLSETPGFSILALLTRALWLVDPTLWLALPAPVVPATILS